MKNILLLLVGGTICTAVSNMGTLTVSEKAGSLLKNNFLESGSVFADKVNIDLTENLFLLSENMTADKWTLILKTYRKYTEAKEYDGVVIAHGTDTLAYSASLFSLILSSSDIPVFFVSSNRRLDAEGANGNANFRYAVECICKGIAPNIYATYRNPSDGRMYLHLASRLKQCANYSEDFYSSGMLDITDNSESAFTKILSEIKDKYSNKSNSDFSKKIAETDCISDCVLNISPCVGINYDSYRYEMFKAVLHGTYHSGTVCVEQTETCPEYGRNSVLRMLDTCTEKDVDVYFSPAKNEGEIYDTVRIVANHTVNGKAPGFLYGMTNEMTYAKLLLAYSVFSDRNDILSFINTEINFEFTEK